jgi:hypothetical protein
MALGARLAETIARDGRLLVNAPLGIILHTFGLVGRQSMRSAERFDDGPRFRWCEPLGA